MSELSTKEISKRLGIPLSTVKNWASRLPIPHREDNAGNRRFSEETLEVFEAIKKLRGDNRGYESIRLIIQPEPSPSQAEAKPSEPGEESGLGQGSSLDNQLIVAQVIEAISSQTDLAEKYARAAHQIGTLEERVRVQAEQIVALEEKLKLLLEAPKADPEVKRPWWKLF